MYGEKYFVKPMDSVGTFLLELSALASRLLAIGLNGVQLYNHDESVIIASDGPAK